MLSHGSSKYELEGFLSHIVFAAFLAFQPQNT
jgi:hypothetical protein